MRVTLYRLAYTSMGVFGQLRVDGFECFTVERPWAKNMPSVSCIPTGKYALIPRKYNRGGYNAYEIMDVPGRTEIKIHKGNRAKDVQGCIAPGTELGAITDEWAVLHSGDAFEAFMLAMDGRSCDIEIINTTGVG